MLNPPYGERIAAKGQGSDAARQGFEGGGSSAEFFGGLAGALEAPLRRLDRLAAQPRHEAAVADAAEGKPPRADVERPDRVSAFPIRHGGGLEQGRRSELT